MKKKNTSEWIFQSRHDFSHIYYSLVPPVLVEQVNSGDSYDPASISTLQAWKEGLDSGKEIGEKEGFSALKTVKKGLNSMSKHVYTFIF